MATNPYEASARQNKAFALASHLHQYEVKAHEVRSITQEQWKAIADLMTTLRRCLDADAPAMHPPSAETIAEIETMMRTLENPRDPAESFRRCRA